MANKRKRKKHTKLILLIELVLILIAIAVGIIVLLYSKINKSDWDDGKVYTNELNDDNMSRYINIALFGVDSRANDLTKNTRSDSIMIASINKYTNKIKLLSLYRDTYVFIPEHGYTKLNHAYAYGGPKLAIETINRNFDMNITDYITVNFSALTDVIDALGGVTINVTSEELNEVNRYAKDVARINGREWTKIEKAGEQTLTGVQATGYSRVRYLKGGDYARAGRQRTVIDAIIKKARHSGPKKLYNAADCFLPQIATSLSGTEFARLISFFPLYNIESQDGFPFDKTNKTINKAAVVVCNTLPSNVKKLHEYLFETKDYNPSQTVVKISKGS